MNQQQQQQQRNNGKWRVAELLQQQQQQEQQEFHSVDISDAYNIAELNEERLALVKQEMNQLTQEAVRECERNVKEILTWMYDRSC